MLWSKILIWGSSEYDILQPTFEAAGLGLPGVELDTDSYVEWKQAGKTPRLHQYVYLRDIGNSNVAQGPRYKKTNRSNSRAAFHRVPMLH